MKHSIILTWLIIIVLLIPVPAFGQLIKIGAGGGVTQILAPDNYTREVPDGGFGYSTEWNAGIIGKVALPLIPISPKVFLLYHSLAGSGAEPPHLHKAMHEEGELEYSQSILEIGAGAQFNFIPSTVGFDPYIALDLSYTSFGKGKVNDQQIPNSESLSRFGGGVGIGSEITIIPMINLDLYLNYKMFNLIGKEDGEETVSAITLDAFIIFNFL